MTSFYYYDQNLSGFCFLVLIRALVIQTSLGLQNLKMKGKTKNYISKQLSKQAIRQGKLREITKCLLTRRLRG